MHAQESRDQATKLPRDWELGLSVLECYAAPGRCFTQAEIGCACGVTNAAVAYCEQVAMRKLRVRLQFTEAGRELLRDMREFLRQLDH